MYDIQQFMPTLYVLILLGITGFCVATNQPELWLLATVGVLVNGWLIKRDRFRPMPRLIANTVSVLGLLYVYVQTRSDHAGSSPIVLVGNFLVMLHLVKLYEQRFNRDYAQLLVISLLLVVAALISTASLIFAILLLAYLLISLYCGLLFHLKVETDQAKVSMHLRSEPISPTPLKQDQRFLSRSMRRVTALIAVISLTSAVAVFLFFPRGAMEGVFGKRALRSQPALSGFSEHVSFEDVAKISRNEAVVADVHLSRGGKTIGGSPIYLRGTTLDYYSGSGDSGPSWQWSREEGSDGRDWDDVAMPAATPDCITQEFVLQPIGTPALFAIGGIVARTGPGDMRVQYHTSDGTLSCNELQTQNMPVQYSVVSNGTIPTIDRSQAIFRSVIDPRIAAYARRPDVCGTDAQGRPLASLLDTANPPPDIERQIAQHIETHLQTKFTYTLDLSDAAKIPAGQDPMVAFLYTLKRGHCEYFAGSMALMCQSLRIPARVVVGFRTDEYNSMGGFYVVRQSHAHAWVEVLTNSGWETFDPTSSLGEGDATQAGMFSRIRNVYDYLEYKWGASVVAYGQQDRQTLVQSIDNAVAHAAVQQSGSASRVMGKLQSLSVWDLNPAIMTFGGGGLLIVVGVWMIYGRLRLWRRARRLGLTNLPTQERDRLARQLEFYEDLLRLLEKHQILPPRHLTPLEFSLGLSYLPREVYDTVRRMTLLFYRIRYGGAELSAFSRRKVQNSLTRLETLMAHPDAVQLPA